MAGSDKNLDYGLTKLLFDNKFIPTGLTSFDPENIQES